MERQYYLDLAAQGLSMPIGADLVLHQYPDPEAIALDGKRLGEVVVETARRFATPLAFAHMDLELEKRTLLEMLGVAPDAIAKFHFDEVPGTQAQERVETCLRNPLNPAMEAQIAAIQYVSRHSDLVPIGMSIGPFSLMTKLIADPIYPVCMAGAGVTGDDDEAVRQLDAVMDLGMRLILHAIRRQLAAGAKAVFIAEPAANKVYISPSQIETGSDVFERYVTKYSSAIRTLLADHGADLVFHCCGELTDYMVRQFASLDPAILSLGSSRSLWEDASLVPKSTVLYGNLPSKRFYSDELVSLVDVERQGQELKRKMAGVGHPFILGSECDVLSVPGRHESLMKKAEAIARCR